MRASVSVLAKNLLTVEIERWGGAMPGRKDCTGQRFGRLVAVSFVGRKHHNAVWLFRCYCGSEHGASISNVARQDRPIRSCGCLYCEVAGTGTTDTIEKSVQNRSSACAF